MYTVYHTTSSSNLSKQSQIINSNPLPFSYYNEDVMKSSVHVSCFKELHQCIVYDIGAQPTFTMVQEITRLYFVRMMTISAHIITFCHFTQKILPHSITHYNLKVTLYKK